MAEDRSENEKHQRAEAGAEALKLVYRPPGHCRQTMSRFVLTSESDYCAGHYPTSFDSRDRLLAYRRRRYRPLRPKAGQG